MPIQTTSPDGDVTTEWGVTPPGDHFAAIDEPVASADTADFINASGLADTDQFSFPADAPADMDVVTRVDVALSLAGLPLTLTPGLTISLWVGAAKKAERSFDVTTVGWQVFVFQFTGLSLSKAEYNALEVRLVDGPGSGEDPPDIVES